MTVLLALSGWATIVTSYLETKPDIVGRIVNSMIGQLDYDSKRHTTFTTYVYLLNSRNNVMHILDYEMEIYLDNKWHKLDRLYDLKPIDLTFTDQDNKLIKIKNFSNNLINYKQKPVQKGIPLHGWLVFIGSKELHNKLNSISKYKLICIDAMLNKHEIITKTEEFQSLLLLKELTEIEFTSEESNF